ncbi:hypothetical protein A3Q56_06665 [Intoshia linei]|uniref:ArsA/GET3 Anion-transporting ATPase-like domain-containing protein n=1 Tax=Intoshia linei TaxID=1819745 RepID=A0A177AWK5_9BILA|nr:hypothetical protein A3Q56_06665 [Intoshia linei]
MTQLESEYEPSLKNIIDKKSLKWVFVGGKGGVGKTTVSCCLAINLAKNREKVLLISTDPAHNLSDFFAQKIGHIPTKLENYSNLEAMEIDPSLKMTEMPNFFEEEESEDNSNAFFNVVKLFKNGGISKLFSQFPGVDEAMAYMEVMKLVRSMNYSIVVFDTAPTGHTLRLLTLPSVMESTFTSIDSQIGGIMGSLGGVIGVNSNIQNTLTNKITNLLPNIRLVKSEFENADLTTFVCVCISEFLSLFETERLVQKLNKNNININNVVVNQLLLEECSCKMCISRRRMQKKYLDEIIDLYDDFHLTLLPLLEEEVRGQENIEKFCKLLIDPHKCCKTLE